MSIENLINQKVSRRTLLKAGAVGGISLFTGIGCTKADKQNSLEPGETPSPKPNTGGGDEPYRPQNTATATDSNPATATATSTPERSPLEKALEAKRIELKTETDWENYFIPVSRQEAGQLLKEVQSANEFKYILPFDPRSENVILENYIYINSGGIELSRLAIRNLHPGTNFYSPVDSKTMVGKSGNKVDGNIVPTAYSIQIVTPQMRMGIVAPLDVRVASPFAEQQVTNQIDAQLGQSLIYSSASHVTGNNKEQYSVEISIASGENIDKLRALGGGIVFAGSSEEINKLSFLGADMSNLLTKNGKIAFIDTSMK